MFFMLLVQTMCQYIFDEGELRDAEEDMFAVLYPEGPDINDNPPDAVMYPEGPDINDSSPDAVIESYILLIVKEWNFFLAYYSSAPFPGLYIRLVSGGSWPND